MIWPAAFLALVLGLAAAVYYIDTSASARLERNWLEAAAERMADVRETARELEAGALSAMQDRVTALETELFLLPEGGNGVCKPGCRVEWVD